MQPSVLLPTPLLYPAPGIEPDFHGTFLMDGPHLSQLLDEAVARRPDHTAVQDEHGRRLSFAALGHGADRLATRLARWGVGRGDRVGLWLPKSLQAVTAIHGILRCGCRVRARRSRGAGLRAASIFAAAGVKAVVVDGCPCRRAARRMERPRPSAPDDPRRSRWKARADADQLSPPAAVCRGIAAGDARWTEIMADDAPSPLAPCRDPDDLAYILFTSGSTGQPKGVMLSHANAFTFLDWCQETLGPWDDDDRFSSHAPFHFDLSIFDLFVSCRNAATLVLIGESLAREPEPLGDFLAERAYQRLVLGPVDPGAAHAARRARPAGLRRAAAGALRRRGLPGRPVAAAEAALARGTALEPLRSDRDQRLHGAPHSGRHPRRSNRALPDRLGLPAVPGTGGRRGWPGRAARCRSASW